VSIIRILLAGFVVLLAVASANAITITVGNHTLLANTPGQQVQIVVSGGEQVSGVNLHVQVGDGGPELVDFGLPPGVDGPAITAVDLTTGTIFAGVSDTPFVIETIPQYVNYSLAMLTPGSSVPAAGLLATLTIDTTGFTSGTWDLLLSDVLPGLGGDYDTDFAPTPATILNGSLSVGVLLGDANYDGLVNDADATILASHWHQTSGMTWSDGDFNGDGRVNDSDASILAAHWYVGAGGEAASIPEPATFVLLIGGLSAWLWRRRMTG
jgi:hypothetical protein